MSEEDGVRVRLCRASDRASLLALGHPAGVAPVLAPPIALRLRWFLGGTLAAGFVAERGRPAGLVGSIHFVRDRRDPRTWMFGHWRVLPACRRSGIGRRLVREGIVSLPGVDRLYSQVDWGNEVSLQAHERLGFEAAPELQGMAPLSALASVGPPAPAIRLREIGTRDPAAGRIYARSMGELWSRLMPALEVAAALDGRLFVAEDGGSPAALVRLWKRDIWIFAIPEACDAALLSRLAGPLRDRGVPLEADVALRGLPRSLAARGGAIVVQVLMGLTDTRRLR